ncbi:hypothetical protein BG006_004188 [Podila minutissima]|uniref:Uncharacterized protein n=1 Tax=Podila minutissima TaxID=64525 RepID=A0A9P5SM17_9FUNG|nr:hypothetical protein BG006_004188 [Podila minutissima]
MTSKLSERFSNPEAIDPARLSTFATSSDIALLDHLQQQQQQPVNSDHTAMFLDSFHKCFPGGSSIQNLGTTSLHIIQQPKPAKQRGRYIEVKDIRKLCNLGELDAVVMVLVPNCPPPPLAISSLAYSSTPSSSSESMSPPDTAMDTSSLDTPSLDSNDSSDSLCGGSAMAADTDGSFEYFENIQIVSQTTNMPQVYISQPCLPQSATAFEQAVSSRGNCPTGDDGMNHLFEDLDHDDYGDETDDLTGDAGMFRRFQRRRKRISRSQGTHDSSEGDDDQQGGGGGDNNNKTTTPRRDRKWFRPLVEDGKIQFEIWVAAFLKAPVSADFMGEDEEDVDGTGKGAMTAAQKREYSLWVQRVTELLETRCVQAYVQWEVSRGGRIGIDYREMMRMQEEDKKSSRRRVIR